MAETKPPRPVRQAILAAGHQLILHKGFSAVGLQQILSACGVPKGSFYHYFASKEAFGCALLEQYIADYEQRLTQLFSEQEDGKTRLMHYWRNWIDAPDTGSWAENCLVVKLAAEIADLSEEMRTLLSAGVGRLIGRIARTLEDGRRDGSLPTGMPAEALARTLYQMWLGAALMAKLDKDGAPLQHALAMTEQLLADTSSAPHSTPQVNE